MNKKFTIACFGELLIDFTQDGYDQNGAALFARNAGGAPANVAVCVSKMGGKAAFLGKVGKDMHGAFLRDTLLDYGVDCTGLVTDANVYTTMAFVRLSESGERSFSFARKPGADAAIAPWEINREIIQNAQCFHFGSFSMSTDLGWETTKAAIALAKESGALVSFDVNYRPSVWQSETLAKERILSVLADVDILKLSDTEAKFLTDSLSLEDQIVALYRLVSFALLTGGEQGAMVIDGWGTRHVPACKVSKVVDTTGAGDCFYGAFLSKYLSEQPMTRQGVDECARFASAAAALCVGRKGAIPAIPSKEEAESMKTRSFGSLQS